MKARFGADLRYSRTEEITTRKKAREKHTGGFTLRCFANAIHSRPFHRIGGSPDSMVILGHDGARGGGDGFAGGGDQRLWPGRDIEVRVGWEVVSCGA